MVAGSDRAVVPVNDHGVVAVSDHVVVLVNERRNDGHCHVAPHLGPRVAPVGLELLEGLVVDLNGLADRCSGQLQLMDLLRGPFQMKSARQQRQSAFSDERGWRVSEYGDVLVYQSPAHRSC